ncbi:amino acid ABC transporter ATP-binding protein [Pseudonocardia sp. MH-G8]|uniref:amino acid ABC transporter ATP-binding protein n=1 Tax=Pseudonocardia sp. MH-G8 TaxID=1854588 RepID=UPI000BA15509|nr:amino acid ABC transporter ATP-binding protein [Pseudonocardia sp. MH-G8]OZM78133.1 ectoine/hydroxyectoine ABC transporter ATP-binding protein EhuA [Pseudonocardia sp. MH-G8]
MSDRPFLRAVGIKKRFGQVDALRGVDLQIHRGSVTCLLGPSGSGKSTLLRCLNRLETPDEGYVEIDGVVIGFEQGRKRPVQCSPRRLAAQRRVTGMVFQHFNLFAHLTVEQNVTEGQVHGHGVARNAARTRALELLDRVGLADHAQRYPAQLSGGQQQRVAIARAMATAPKVLLFDEPTSALDPELVGEVLGVMRDLAHDGVTMLVVTHEIAFAEEVATHVHVMNEGSIIESGTPAEVIRSPRHARTQTFLARVTRTDRSDAAAAR